MPSQIDDDRYFDLKGLSAYSGLSVRTLQRHMADKERPLPNHRVHVGGKTRGRVLVKRSEFDAWVENFRPQVGPVVDPDVALAVAKALRGM